MANPAQIHQLSVEFATAQRRRTYVARQFATYPFHICRPFWIGNDPEGMATLYLQSCSGGLFGGESLSMGLVARENAFAHVTTQASTIVHATAGEKVETALEIVADTRSHLEVFNEPLILFPEASLECRVSVRCADDAVLIYCDAFLVHDPKGNSGAFGSLASTFEVSFKGESRPAVIDRMRVDGSSFKDSQPGAAGTWPVHGTMYVVTRRREWLDMAKRVCEGLTQKKDDVYLGGSILPFESGAVLRIAAASPIGFRRSVFQVWSLLRQEMFGMTPQPRKK